MLVENECVESTAYVCLNNVKSQCTNVSVVKEITSELPKKEVSKEFKQPLEASIKLNKDKKDKFKDLKVAKVDIPLEKNVTPLNVDDSEEITSLAPHKKEQWRNETSAPLKVEKDGNNEENKTTDPVHEVHVPQVNVTTSIEKDDYKYQQESNVEEIKTEDQAWDMLLTEPDRPIFTINQSLIAVDRNVEESKPKSKKNRKAKKSQEIVQAKSEEDSFVEIHAIEDKQQVPSGDLVSISTPYDNLELSSSFHTKAKKYRSTKSITPERKNISDFQIDTAETESTTVKSQSINQSNEKGSHSAMMSEVNLKPILNNEQIKQKLSDTAKTNTEENENTSAGVKESPKPKKNKSPYLDRRKSVEKSSESEVKDVYVIDTSKDEYPEIQITKSSKSRKKSPQSAERKAQEKEAPEKVVEKPVKSWSSIAASKTVKRAVEEEKEAIFTKEIVENKILKLEDTVSKCTESNDNTFAGPSVSLQDKLIELCKRTDVMIAECDTPTELNFVDEHHSVIDDLPPLDMDFGLDDFKLEVMRDSLIEANDTSLESPICKIDIDSILSNIKESSNRVAESSSFNLIDLEKVPSKQEKGFSFVENDKITTQEVKIDDDTKREMEIMEKSSDDDITSPVLSTDSDKDDKKSNGALTVTSQTKQAVKSKKSRRKKK